MTICKGCGLVVESCYQFCTSCGLSIFETKTDPKQQSSNALRERSGTISVKRNTSSKNSEIKGLEGLQKLSNRPKSETNAEENSEKIKPKNRSWSTDYKKEQNTDNKIYQNEIVLQKPLKEEEKRQIEETNVDEEDGSQSAALWGKLSPALEHMTNDVGESYLTKDEYWIGASNACDIIVVNKHVSGKHFRIYKNIRGEVYIQDNSTNGTYLNGEPLQRGEYVRILQKCEISLAVPNDFIAKNDGIGTRYAFLFEEVQAKKSGKVGKLIDFVKNKVKT